MRRLTSRWRSLPGLALRWESRTRPLAAGRSLIAVATLSELLFTADAGLFSDAPRCTAIGSISLWCVSAATTHATLLARVLSVVVLLLVASGYRPRWTCVPHWYVTFSLFSSLLTPNGGDGAAMIATLLVIPICLGDDRVWQWGKPRHPPSPGWRGSAFAAHMVIRLQVLIVYLVAAVSKISDPAWRHGAGMYYVFNDQEFGIPTQSWPVILDLTQWGLLIRVLSWSVIALQLFVAVGSVGPWRLRLAALLAGVSLHLAIILVMGLPSFGLTMIGLLLVGYGGRAAGLDRPVQGRIHDLSGDRSATSAL
ncbi:sporulation-delaying protein SdpB family protein [Kutzneria sp. CA-103260]|uniref:sporulation-delaying protein SdpB family protein n=1 Tax=Kutzneria sp. CA-103260 TaxID=2802641 RepID=UPI001BA67CBB|nr:sporulation-delaying protein SdpB family protein [Kutzneria sp. CA-103260]QUQ68992.1 Sporulation-delaying protein SdpB [Kutzneria sp. CA-103260]